MGRKKPKQKPTPDLRPENKPKIARGVRFSGLDQAQGRGRGLKPGFKAEFPTPPLNAEKITDFEVRNSFPAKIRSGNSNFGVIGGESSKNIAKFGQDPQTLKPPIKADGNPETEYNVPNPPGVTTKKRAPAFDFGSWGLCRLVKSNGLRGVSL